MFTKFPPVVALALVAGLALAGCGQTPGTAPVGGTSLRGGSATVEAESARIDIRTIEKNIKKQLEKNYPDYSVTLSNLKVWAMPTILPYPAPVPTLFGFSATEQVVGLTGLYQWYQIEGNYSVRTGKAQVTSRLPLPVYAQK